MRFFDKFTECSPCPETRFKVIPKLLWGLDHYMRLGVHIGPFLIGNCWLSIAVKLDVEHLVTIHLMRVRKCCIKNKFAAKHAIYTAITGV